MPPAFSIREERSADRPGVLAVHREAFEGEGEAKLVAELHRTGNAKIALVAELEGRIVGSIVFSPVTIDGAEVDGCLGLAPLAVSKARQSSGIGSELTRRGLEICRRDRVPLVVVLGHPDYYPRFGFQPAAARGFRCEYGDDAPFFVLENRALGLPPGLHLVRYGPEFGEVGE